jgi:hypothetical protein
VVLVGTDVLEECIASIFRVKAINELKNMLAIASDCLFIVFTLKVEVIRSSHMSVPTRTTQQHIPEDDILHSHHHENFKSYNILITSTINKNYTQSS